MLPVLNLSIFVCGCGCHGICVDCSEVSGTKQIRELEQSRTITVICLMLTERAMKSALHWDEQQ